MPESISAYKEQMGEDYHKLHPQIQKRFDFSTANGVAFIGKGVMDRIWTGNRLTVSLLKLLSKSSILFPKTGTNIPYEIHNYPYRDSFGREVHSLNRVFYFPDGEQRFDGTALYSEKHQQIIEYLGLNHKLFFKMDLFAEANGAIRFKSGKQYTFLFGKKIRIPALFTGNIDLVEWFDDAENRFYLDLKVSTKLLGPLFGFTGWFEAEYIDFKQGDLPAHFKPTYEEVQE